MNEEEALDYINQIGGRGSRHGLERTQALLMQMGNPEKKLKFVHVTGTNGKGSVCAMLASILQEAGYCTGLYTSPHLIRFHERMQVNGDCITGAELAEITNFVRKLAEEMEDPPTQFELMTCIGMEFFFRRGCQIVVLEVGMGGLLDSTNVIPPPEVAIFTAIGLDHTKELGDTIEKIAAVKAGIIKSGCSVVLSQQSIAVMEVIEATCQRMQTPLYISCSTKLSQVTMSIDGLSFFSKEYGALTLPLLGAHQLENAAACLGAVTILQERGWKINTRAVRDGLAHTVWLGRFQILQHNPTFIIDGGHNPQGMQTTADTLRALFPKRKITFLTGVMADKDVEAMYAQIAPLAQHFVTVTPENPRALEAETLAERIHSQFAVECTPCESIEQGVASVLTLAGQTGIVCTVGSLYLIGDVYACF